MVFTCMLSLKLYLHFTCSCSFACVYLRPGNFSHVQSISNWPPKGAHICRGCSENGLGHAGWFVYLAYEKPLDHCVCWTNITGTDDQLHHWFGASGRLHGHFNVQDCISRRSGPNPKKVFFCLTILQRCQSFGPMEDFKPPQQKLGRCLGVTAIMEFHGLSSLTMHLFWSGARPATMGEASWFQRLFEDLTHVLAALLI